MQAGVSLRALLGVASTRARSGGSRSRAADVLHAPVALVRELVGELGDDLDEVGELLRVALGEIVGREQVERDDLDADVVAPVQELAHLRGAGTVAVRGGRRSRAAAPSDGCRRSSSRRGAARPSGSSRRRRRLM